MAVYTRKVEAYIRALELQGFDACSSKRRTITVKCSKCTVVCRDNTAEHGANCPNRQSPTPLPLSF